MANTLSVWGALHCMPRISAPHPMRLLGENLPCLQTGATRGRETGELLRQPVKTPVQRYSPNQTTGEIDKTRGVTVTTIDPIAAPPERLEPVSLDAQERRLSPVIGRRRAALSRAVGRPSKCIPQRRGCGLPRRRAAEGRDQPRRAVS